MFQMSRFAVAALLFAGAGLALAQPPGGPEGPGRTGGFEKKEFEKKKDGPRPGAERKEGDRPNAQQESPERELQRLRARISEIEGQLKKSREGGDAKRPEPRSEDQPKNRDSRPAGGPGGPGGFNPMGRGPMGPMGGGPGGFNPMGGGRGGPGGGFAGGPGFAGPGMHLPLEQMSAEQIKQLIGRLQQALEAKSRGDQPKPEGAKGGEDVMRRLERIQKELEDIRRSLGK